MDVWRIRCRQSRGICLVYSDRCYCTVSEKSFFLWKAEGDPLSFIEWDWQSYVRTHVWCLDWLWSMCPLRVLLRIEKLAQTLQETASRTWLKLNLSVLKLYFSSQSCPRPRRSAWQIQCQEMMSYARILHILRTWIWSADRLIVILLRSQSRYNIVPRWHGLFFQYWYYGRRNALFHCVRIRLLLERLCLSIRHKLDLQLHHQESVLLPPLRVTCVRVIVFRKSITEQLTSQYFRENSPPLHWKSKGNSLSSNYLQYRSHCHTNKFTSTRRRHWTMKQTTFDFRLNHQLLCQRQPFDLLHHTLLPTHWSHQNVVSTLRSHFTLVHWRTFRLYLKIQSHLIEIYLLPKKKSVQPAIPLFTTPFEVASNHLILLFCSSSSCLRALASRHLLDETNCPCHSRIHLSVHFSVLVITSISWRKILFSIMIVWYISCPCRFSILFALLLEFPSTSITSNNMWFIHPCFRLLLDSGLYLLTSLYSRRYQVIWWESLHNIKISHIRTPSNSTLRI